MVNDKNTLNNILISLDKNPEDYKDFSLNQLKKLVSTEINKVEIVKKSVEKKYTKKDCHIISNNDSNNITTIYHLADIHIRFLQRHTEYKIVFDNLFEYFEKEAKNIKFNNGLIVIAGDIFHNRDRFISETLVLFDYFITNLLKYFPVVIILGNHDTFTHQNRLNTISGLTQIKNYSNLHFLELSGIYIYNNLNLVVSSCIQNEPFIYFDDLDDDITESGNLNIILYHGQVSGCINENSSYIFTEHTSDSVIKLNAFKHYDLVLLGDIHKRQFLQKNIAYSGSLIQQNFKEDLYEHGLIKWSVNTSNKDISYEEVNIENDYGFIKLYLDVNNELILDDSFKFPKFSFIKLIIENDNLCNSDLAKIEDIKEFIKTKTKILSFNKEIIDKQNDNIKLSSLLEDSNELTNLNTDDDNKELTFINILIDKLNKISDFDIDYIKEYILQIHSQAKKEVEELYNSKNILESRKISTNWTISSLSFKNTLIYGGDTDNFIDFENKKGIIGILGTNAIGKTCIFNIIIYALFGNAFKTKAYNNRNIMNKNAKTFYVKLVIKLNNNDYYIIERSGKHKKRAKTYSIEDTICFKKLENNTEINLTDSTKNITENKILQTLGLSGKKEDFILTNFISNLNYNRSLLFMSNSEIEDTFNSLFNLEIYKEYYKLAHTKLKDFQSVLKVSEGEIKNINNLLGKLNYESLQNDLNINNKQIETLKLDLQTLQTKYETLQDEEQKLIIDDSIDITNLNIEQLQKEHINLSSKIETFNNTNNKLPDNEYTDLENIINNKKSLLNLKQKEWKLKLPIPFDLKINLNEEFEANFNIEDINIEINKLSEKKETINDANTKNIMGNYTEAIEKLKTLSIKDNIISFSSSIDSTLNNLKKSKSGNYILPLDLHANLVYYVKNIKDINLYNKYQDVIKAKNDLDLKINVNININTEITKYKNKIITYKYKFLSNLQTEIDYYTNYLNNKNLETELLNIQNLLTKYTKYSKKIQLNDILKKMEGNILDINKQISQLDKKISVLESKQIDYKNFIKDKELIDLKIKYLEKNVAFYKLYKSIFEDKHLPKLFLADTINLLQNEANKIIFKLTDLKLNIDDNIDENKKWDFNILKGNMVLGIEQCSGYERFIVNIALKIAIDKYKYYSGIKMFFIDECLDCVSDENKERIDDLFMILRKLYYNVIIISHNEDFKKKVSHTIDIEHSNNISKIL